MKLTRDEYDARINRIPESLRRLAHNNVILHTMFSRYAAGHYATLEDALVAAIQALVQQNDSLSLQLQDALERLPPRPFFVARKP